MQRRPRLVIVAALVVVASSCAGDDAELDALRAEVEERRAAEAAVEERLDEMEAVLEATQVELAQTARDARVERLEVDVGETTDALDTVAEELDAASGTIDDVVAALEGEAAARTELDTRLDTAANELSGAIAAVRRAVEDLEGETTMLADRLDALRQRVDVIQAR